MYRHLVAAMCVVSCSAFSSKGANEGASGTAMAVPEKKPSVDPTTNVSNGGTEDDSGSILVAGPDPADASTSLEAASTYSYTQTSGVASWSDTFTRADQTDPGNSWFVSTSGDFNIQSNRIASVSASGTTIAIRPQDEKQLDVEVSIDFALADEEEEVYVLARVLDTSESNPLSGYRLRVASTIVEVGLQKQLSAVSNTYAPFDTIDLTDALLVGHAYRAFFRVSGSNDVLLEAAIFEIGSMVPLYSLRGLDQTSYRILASGRVGFAAHRIGTMIDNFERRDLP